MALHPDVAIRDWDNQSSAWHRWPVALQRNEAMRSGVSTVRVPRDLKPILDYREREAALERQLVEVVSELEAVKATTSWRISAPLRALRARMRKGSA